MRVYIFSKESRGGVGIFIKQLLKLKKINFRVVLYKEDKLSFLSKKYTYLFTNYPQDDKFSFNKIWIFLISLYRTFNYLKSKKAKVIFTCEQFSTIALLLLKIFCFKN